MDFLIDNLSPLSKRCLLEVYQPDQTILIVKTSPPHNDFWTIITLVNDQD